MNRLQLVISNLIEPEQNYAVKGRSIQDNLHLVHEVLEGLKDGTEAVLINLDQSKVFDKVDHWLLATVFEIGRFKLEFHKWISMMYHNPQAVVLVNGMRSEAFAIECCLLSPLLYVLALEPLLCRLRDEKASLVLLGILFAGSLSAKVSTYADDITVFVSCCLDIKAVKKVVARYEQIARANIHSDKSEGLQLGARRGGIPLLGSFHWCDGAVCILGGWFGPGLQLEQN